MLKKILPISLCLALILYIGAMAANSAETENSDSFAASEEMPASEEIPMRGGGRQGGGRGGMGDAPMDGNMPTDETPPPRGGENSGTENPPPQDGENAAEGNTDATDKDSNHMPTGAADSMDGGRQESPQNVAADESEASNGIFNFIKAYSTPITSLILLALAFVFVIFYKRKTY